MLYTSNRYGYKSTPALLYYQYKSPTYYPYPTKLQKHQTLAMTSNFCPRRDRSLTPLLIRTLRKGKVQLRRPAEIRGKVIAEYIQDVEVLTVFEERERLDLVGVGLGLLLGRVRECGAPPGFLVRGDGVAGVLGRGHDFEGVLATFVAAFQRDDVEACGAGWGACCGCCWGRGRG